MIPPHGVGDGDGLFLWLPLKPHHLNRPGYEGVFFFPLVRFWHDSPHVPRETILSGDGCYNAICINRPIHDEFHGALAPNVFENPTGLS